MEFKKCKLGSIANITMGQSPKGTSYNNDGIGKPFLQGNKTFGRLYPTIDTWTTEPKKMAKKGEILMSVRAPVGDLNIANKEICIGRGLCSIEMTNGNNMYLLYLLKNSLKEIKRKSSGTVFDSINRIELEEIDVVDFDEKIQNKIIKILSKFDEKIELNNQINDNLLKLNNQLYEEYFINNVDENTNEVYLKDLIKVVNGYSYKGSELADKSDIGLATIKNFERKGGFKEDGFKPLNPQKIKEEQIVEKNDILVACTDLTQQADIIGNAVLLLGKVEYEKIIISMDLVKIIPKENIDKYVVFSILNSREFKSFTS